VTERTVSAPLAPRLVVLPRGTGGERAGSGVALDCARMERLPCTVTVETPEDPSASVREPQVVLFWTGPTGATYTVTPKDSALVLSTRWASDATLRPAYADAFVGPFLVNFSRTGGKVEGMLMSSGRVRRVRFVKTR
jgi:hypothetical protein